VTRPIQILRATYGGFTDYVFDISGVLRVVVIPWLIYPALVLVTGIIDTKLAFFWLGAASQSGLYGFAFGLVIPFALPYLVLWEIGRERRNRLYASLPKLLSAASQSGKLILWSEVESIEIEDAGIFKLSTSKKVYRMWASSKTRDSIIKFAESTTQRRLSNVAGPEP
jgi:hypothetical protein